MLGFSRQRTIGAVVGKTLAATLATGAAILPAVQPAQAQDTSNRTQSRNNLAKIPGARTARDFNDVGWGGPTQGRNNPHARGEKDSYDAFPRLATGQRGSFNKGGYCITVEGGDMNRNIPRHVVGRTRGACP